MKLRDIGMIDLEGHTLTLSRVIDARDERQQRKLEQGLHGERLLEVAFKKEGIDWVPAKDWYDSEKDGYYMQEPGEVKTAFVFDKYSAVALNESSNWSKWDRADHRFFVAIHPKKWSPIIQIYECEDYKKCKLFNPKDPRRGQGRYRAYYLDDMRLMHEFRSDELFKFFDQFRDQ